MLTRTKLIELEEKALARFDRRCGGPNLDPPAMRNMIRDIFAQLAPLVVDDTQKTTQPCAT